MPSLTVRDARLRRHRRVRAKVRGSAERPRLVVFRSNRGIEAQLIDDDSGKTLASASHLALAKSFKGADLELNVGYSHPVTVKPRTGITFEVPTPTEIFVKGTDKQMVGQTAAEIRKVRPPEPYKGKGIRYEGEYVRRKVGKRA